MLLRRNLLTILSSVIFVLVFGIGFLEVAQLAVLETTNRNIIACIFVLGIAIYLIVAFFVKEGRYCDFFQESSVFSNLLEGFLVLFVCGTMFFLTMERGNDNALLIVIMLLSIYTCARLLGGRLCGSFALVAGFFFILHMANYYFDSEEYINCLCFLIPYAAFLWITQYIIKIFAKRGFILFCSYVFLAVLFALAVSVNPFVCVLLIGCTCSLVFGKVKEENASRMANGPIAAAVFVVFTAGLLVGYKYLLVDLSLFPSFDLDSRLFENTDIGKIVEYCIIKYTRAMQYIYRPFTFSFFPAILMFLGCVSGYYAIRKRTSGIGPLCLTYIILLAYYVSCNELGTHFYYLTFFLPVFTAYGIYGTLCSDEAVRNEDVVPEEIRQKNEHDYIPEAEPAIPENQMEESKALAEHQHEEKAKENGLEESMKKENQEDISLNVEPEEIPEWTISQDYITKIKSAETELPEEEPVLENEWQTNDVVEEEVPIAVPESDAIVKSKAYENEPEATVELSVEDVDAENTIQVEELGSEALNIDKEYKIASPEILETEQVDEGKSESYMQDLGSLKEKDFFDDYTDTIIRTDSEEEDAQLDNLLERLDISENIRRMKESATEDLADVIERVEEREELLTAIPAEEMNYETENLVYTLDLDKEEPKVESEPDFEEREPAGFHSLPKYVKPDFDFSMESLAQPLSNNEPVISEYDRVPTINDLERKWRELNETNDLPNEPVVSEEPTKEPVIEPAKEPVVEPAKEPVIESVMEPFTEPAEEPLIEKSMEELVTDTPSEQFEEEIKEEQPEEETGNGFAYSLEEVSKTLEEVRRQEEKDLSDERKPVIHSEEVVKRTAAGKRSYHRITLG